MRRLLLLLLLCVAVSGSARQRTIKTVSPVVVETPQGTVPRLPWQLWVTYSDGKSEWRQVRWTNCTSAIEEEETRIPEGVSYEVDGYVIGDNTTADGFPVKATVRVKTGAWQTPNPKPSVKPLPLCDVRITGNNRLTNNRDLDIRTLLELDITQQLYNYRDTYGLPTEGYTKSDGWDSPTTKLKGHGTGHYMSALAFAYASAQNEEQKQELLKCITRMVTELRECQERTFVWSDSLGRYFEARDYAPEEELKKMKGTWSAFDEYKKDFAHYGYGYLNAIPAAHPALIECYRAYNNEEWVWAPYYTIHKQLAGLIDIANVMSSSNPEVAAKALLIAKDMGLWVWNRMHYRTYVSVDGNRDERRARPGNRFEMWDMYIAGEVGGMSESLARLSGMVDDATESSRLLEAANCFDAKLFFSLVGEKGRDDLRTRHANQHIPMITGALRSYRGNGNAFYYNLARNFWNHIQGRYAYAMGGVGNGEMWRQPYSQMMNMMPNPNINETCCAYNLAKLTKDLNCYTPDDAALMDYYERLLYNQIVGSVHPDHWACTYQYAVGTNATKPYGNETPQSTCCGGTGVESPVKYQEATYFVGDDALWVALYMPTVATWREKNVVIEQECSWPAEHSNIIVKEGGKFSVNLRVPYWTTKGFRVSINGVVFADSAKPCSYLNIPKREWKQGDRIEVDMPFATHICYGPDKLDGEWIGALMRGPLVMATPDVSSWDEAYLTLRADLSDVATTGTAPYEVKVAGRTFLPDYYLTNHSTHYMHLKVGKPLKAKAQKRVDKAPLEQALLVAHDRQANRWNWARYGMDRLNKKVVEAETVNAKLTSVLTQKEVVQITEELNAVLNAMRPANLAEPEELAELQSLMTSAKQSGTPSGKLQEALDYATMVERYVMDGSGTRDMISKAVKQLKDACGK